MSASASNSLRGDDYIKWLTSNTTDVIDFGFYKLYCLLTHEQVKHFISNVLPFSYNIELDSVHIDEIRDAVEKFPYIGQDFTVAQYSDMTCTSPAQLIDGHHRQQAILQLYQKYPDIPLYIKIGVRVHKTDCPKCPKSIELFEALNNCKPVKVDVDIIKNIVCKVITKLRLTFKKSISDSENPNLSNLSVGKLNKALYDRISKMPASATSSNICDPDIISNKIINYNKLLASLDLSQLINELNVEGKLDSIEKKWKDAKAKGCFLRFLSYEKIAEIGLS